MRLRATTVAENAAPSPVASCSTLNVIGDAVPVAVLRHPLEPLNVTMYASGALPS
jgi:hypothetical protein